MQALLYQLLGLNSRILMYPRTYALDIPENKITVRCLELSFLIVSEDNSSVTQNAEVLTMDAAETAYMCILI